MVQWNRRKEDASGLFLGIDIGSTTVKAVLLNGNQKVHHSLYQRTKPDGTAAFFLWWALFRLRHMPSGVHSGNDRRLPRLRGGDRQRCPLHGGHRQPDCRRHAPLPPL